MLLRVGNRMFQRDVPELDSVLAQAYRDKLRPQCLCVPAGVDMYIAKINGHHYLKRMPNSGGLHIPGCEAYEPPAELSGFGEVCGRAIQEDIATGETRLKLDFALSKAGHRGAPVAGPTVVKPSVKSDGNKLSLRGLLHYLWSEAGFTKWTPRMAGKRNWYVLRKYLREAAVGKTAKGISIASHLFIPELFSVADKAAIESRRRQHFHAVFGASKDKVKPLMLLLGEVKAFTPHRCYIKHLPDTPFMLEPDLYKRLLKNFAAEIERGEIADDTHLVLFATFEISEAGAPWLREVVLMNTTADWIPYESLDEKALLERLCEERRSFVKGLRYNLSNTCPLVSVMLSDLGPSSTALYVIPSNSDQAYADDVHRTWGESQIQAWLWDATHESMPVLPLPDLS